MSAEYGKTIAFKCSFGSSKGWGHVVRCSALAAEFSWRGWETELWAEDDPIALPSSARNAFTRTSANMSAEASVLVVDEMYASDEALESVVTSWRAEPSARIAVGIDDMQERTMAAFDLVVNTEIGLRSADYQAANMLLGESYAMLRQGFAAPIDLPQESLPMTGKSVLVMLGGTDPFGYTARVLNELASWDATYVAPVVITGSSNRPGRELLDTLENFRSSCCFGQLDAGELAAWMQHCSFGVVGCGTSVYELAAMRLPFVGLSLIDNQTATARKAEEVWRMPIVYREGKHDQPLNLASALNRVAKLERKAYSEVDTAGAARVCGAIVDCLENEERVAGS